MLVDPDAVLALPVTRQGFEAVARKLRQVAEAGCRFKEPEPLFGLAAEPFERGDPLTKIILAMQGPSAAPCARVGSRRRPMAETPPLRGSRSSIALAPGVGLEDWVGCHPSRSMRPRICRNGRSVKWLSATHATSSDFVQVQGHRGVPVAEHRAPVEPLVEVAAAEVVDEGAVGSRQGAVLEEHAHPGPLP